MPTIDADTVKNLVIPIPALEVQREIVKIFDKFTELITLLEKEQTARRKQYSYFLENLLTFPDSVEFKAIKDVYTRLRGTPITARKMREIEKQNGNIKIFAGGKTVTNAFQEDIPNANITRVPAVIVQSRGIIDFIFYDEPFTFKNEMWAYTCDEKISVKFLYYVLKKNTEYFRLKASVMGSLPQISLPITEDFKIPFPPLAEQKRIVKILDRFEKLCNSLTDGIPAEIAAREKQYEYYRDKLLTFRPKNK